MGQGSRFWEDRVGFGRKRTDGRVGEALSVSLGQASS